CESSCAARSTSSMFTIGFDEPPSTGWFAAAGDAVAPSASAPRTHVILLHRLAFNTLDLPLRWLLSSHTTRSGEGELRHEDPRGDDRDRPGQALVSLRE